MQLSQSFEHRPDKSPLTACSTITNHLRKINQLLAPIARTGAANEARADEIADRAEDIEAAIFFISSNLTEDQLHCKQ